MSAWGQPRHRDPLGSLAGLLLLLGALALPLLTLLWKLWAAAKMAQLHKIVSGL